MIIAMNNDTPLKRGHEMPAKYRARYYHLSDAEIGKYYYFEFGGVAHLIDGSFYSTAKFSQFSNWDLVKPIGKNQSLLLRVDYAKKVLTIAMYARI